jgi:hypothetical protein
MEPIVVFSAGLVIYCGYIALADALHDLRRGSLERKHCVEEKSPECAVKPPVILSARRRAGGGGGHWPGTLAGSV